MAPSIHLVAPSIHLVAPAVPLLVMAHHRWSPPTAPPVPWPQSPWRHPVGRAWCSGVGRHPANQQLIFPSFFLGSYTSQVLQDFFHQQYQRFPIWYGLLWNVNWSHFNWSYFLGVNGKWVVDSSMSHQTNSFLLHSWQTTRMFPKRHRALSPPI